MAPVTSHMRLPVAILAINSFMITLSFIVVVLRLWSRTFKRITLQSSDYVIILAWVSLISLDDLEQDPFC